MPVINIAKDFTEFPTGRLKKYGNDSGEQFREDYLIPALETGEKVTVIFDGTSGYPASFLEEAFGGLIRKGYRFSDLKDQLILQAEAPEFQVYLDLAWQYSREASEANSKT